MPHFRAYCKRFSSFFINFAAVVELADARDSKSRDGDIVWVRPPPAAPPTSSVQIISELVFL